MDGVQTQPILPVGTWKIAGVNVTSDRVWFAIIIVAIAAALAAAYRFTRFGLLTRAAANSEKGAYVSGIKPDRIAAANWMISRRRRRASPASSSRRSCRSPPTRSPC